MSSTSTPAGIDQPGFGNFDRRPVIEGGSRDACEIGWPAVVERLCDSVVQRRAVVAIDCYIGVDVERIIAEIAPHLSPSLVVRAADAFFDSDTIDEIVAPFLGGDDPLFGVITNLTLDDLVDRARSTALRADIADASGVVLVVGPGAARFDPDLVVIADLPRWEAQQRHRSGMTGNLGADNAGAPASSLYKRAYFVDWRIADRWKLAHLAHANFVLDTTITEEPRLVTGDGYRDALERTVRRPFRLVPFFDPGPWGGHWMEAVCSLPTDRPNHAWCFDCVPEENSLLHGFGDIVVETPAINLVLRHPRALLGERVVEQFGAEFPIRFDLLDTMGGGNLSLQVHPTPDYITRFGMGYTQDESYYILDATAASSVYLGTRTETNPDVMLAALRAAQGEGAHFDTDRFVNRWPVRRHDHLSIPAGTIHCSGADTVVLEISATPFIFTFKLWDWGRLGLDGRPRPINIDRGAEVIDWSRTTEWVADELVDQIELVAEGPGFRVERTGLHESGFIETHRHWFREPVLHTRDDSVDVLNLVEGAEITVESPERAFEPFRVHYAETFVVPASVGPFTVRPSGPSAGMECATICARVRARPDADD